jgi:CheY-like chemotaxis protein/anti-sigma regulatory factor (Ser/Thr protein kinase)
MELPGEPVWVDADPVRLEQVLDNLLSNAVKFTDSGGRVTVRVSTQERNGAGDALVTVSDTGVGIPPELVPRLFEPFSQADRTLHRTPGGRGLGLALVKGLVELHGGEVRVHSDGDGRGAEFTLRLPTVPAASTDPAVPDPVPSETGPARILIVEDNRDTAASLCSVLELSGFTVEVVHRGTAALDAARRFQPSTVLCDLGLPGMDGYQVASALRHDPETASVRLIAVSGYGQEEDRRRARTAGFDRHLTKPVDPEELLQLLTAPAL